MTYETTQKGSLAMSGCLFRLLIILLISRLTKFC